MLEKLGLLVLPQRLDDGVDLAVEDRFEAVDGEADAVVRQAVLGEVVGADLLGALAGAGAR